MQEGPACQWAVRDCGSNPFLHVMRSDLMAVLLCPPESTQFPRYRSHSKMTHDPFSTWGDRRSCAFTHNLDRICYFKDRSLETWRYTRWLIARSSSNVRCQRSQLPSLPVIPTWLSFYSAAFQMQGRKGQDGRCTDKNKMKNHLEWYYKPTSAAKPFRRRKLTWT